MSYPNPFSQVAPVILPPSDKAVKKINNLEEPFEYDGYYNARVKRSWGLSLFPAVFGLVSVLLGIAAAALTTVDLIKGAMIQPAVYNPNYKTRGAASTGENSNLAAYWNENSIWPTLGKGIWVGLVVRNTFTDDLVRG